MVTTTKLVPLEEEDLTDDNTINVFVPTPSKRRKRAEVESSDIDDAKVVTPSPKKRKVLPVRMKEGDEELLSSSRPVVEVPARKMTPESNMASTEAPKSSKKTHRRFGSEEPVEEFFSTAREPAVADDNKEGESAEENEDSDDDAPEAIGMQEAAEAIKAREQDAAKAVKEQKEASRQKRKERDEALRKQAEAAKKRKSKASKGKVVITIESDSDEQEAMDEEADDGVPNLAHDQSPSNLLPLEFLEDDEPNELVPIQETVQRVSKKHKFRDISQKAPKDKRVGGTIYRVTKKQSTNLAPKAAHHARSVKESWMQGRSGTKIDPSRKAFSRGFFKK